MRCSLFENVLLTEVLHLQSISILLLSAHQPLGEALVIAPAVTTPSTENLCEAMHSFI